MKRKVLVVDDSAFMRKIISAQIEKIPELVVVQTARSGEDALRKIPFCRPDIITLDIEMPGMNGLETLAAIKERHAMPVIMMSSISDSGTTIRALEAGATDFIEKPVNLREEPEAFLAELRAKLTLTASVPAKSAVFPADAGEKETPVLSVRLPQRLEAVVIGASTGGPRTLASLIKALPAQLSVPIFIVQHMPKGFTASFAERLDALTPLRVMEAAEDMPIEPGHVYIAPGDYHLSVTPGRLRLDQETKLNGVRPAVDKLFESAAGVYGPNLLAVILTGMGRDGTSGLKKIKQKGGVAIAQDEATSIVYGMPKSAVEAGVVDGSFSLDRIADLLAHQLPQTGR